MEKQRIAATIVATFFLICAAGSAQAQSITVLPVSIQMLPGQQATTLTIINQGSVENAVQIRAFTWTQVNGEEQLTASDDVLASPPLATIAPGATQVVRVVLRNPAAGKEATYRILLDQIPPAAAPGTVRIALRLSIPVFAPPPVRVAPHLAFRVEKSASGQSYLVADNTGTAHEMLRDMQLTTTGDGAKLNVRSGPSPYLLAGTTRRWAIASDSLPATGNSLHLTAHGVDHDIVEDVPIVVERP
ncbi:MAG: fimbria/pilus periplasmic chaperone [Rhizomicrobium sp.]